MPTDPDVTTSAPRPTCPAPIEATAEEMDRLLAVYRIRTANAAAATYEHQRVTLSPCPPTIQVIAEAVLTCAEAWDPDARLIGNVKAGDVVRLARYATAPPAIPADLRALLDAMAATRAALDAIPELDEATAIAKYEAEDALIAWTRAHAGGAPAPLTDDELAAMWRRRIGTSPSPNGMTLMRAIRDHAGGGR